MRYLIAAMLLIIACSGGASPTTQPTSTSAPAMTTTSTPAVGSTSTSTSTTSAATSTTVASTTSVPPTYRASPTLAPPEPLPGSDGAAGSGCSPGAGALPDGIWFGMAEEVGADQVMFDLACFFFGDAANEAAEEDGVEEVPVPNDYYIRNQVDTLRSVPIADTAVVHTLGTAIEDGFESVPYTEWIEQEGGYVPCPGEFCLAWLYVNSGEVTEIVEQYTP